MPNQSIQCGQTCKELCTAIEAVTADEKKAILLYAALRDMCVYPDVKTMLNELILQKKNSIELLEKTKAQMKAKFEVLDQIRSGFEMEL
jgi:rubrerythrin